MKGFKVLRLHKFPIWRAFPVSEMGEWHENKECFNGGKLEPIVALVGKTNINIGCCDDCGHITYIHKPSRGKINKYYKKEWLKGESEAILKLASKYGQFIESKGLKGTYLATQKKKQAHEKLIENLDIDKGKNVLDVGCGIGKDLYHYKKLGFKNVFGVEGSEARANVNRNIYKCKVYHGAFEDVEFKEKYGLISFHHVLEHAYNPDEFIKKCASLQEEGDYLFVSVPNFVTEPSMGILFFFPHLHSFTRDSLKILLRRNGYEIVDNSLTNDGEICLVAQKTEDTFYFSEDHEEEFSPALNKLQIGLGLKPDKEMMIIWEREYDGVIHASRKHLTYKANFTDPRSMTTVPVDKYLTDVPIEIHYTDELYYK